MLFGPLKKILANKQKVATIDRCGMIMYMDVMESKMKSRYFCVATDRKTGELTDTGGGIKKTLDRSVISTAIRETREESLGVFDDLLNDKLDENVLLENAYAITDYKTLIIFWKVKVNRHLIDKEFKSRLLKYAYPEVSALTWLEKCNLIRVVFHRVRHQKFYYKVNALLQRAGNFYAALP